MSSRTEELRERLFAKAAIVAESSDPTARTIGRLLASEITDAMSDFLDKEQASNSNLIKIARDYVKKGDLVGIEGQLEYRQWEKDGQKHTTAEVVVGFSGRLHLLGSASGGGSDNRGSSRRDDGRGSSQRRDDYGSGSRGGNRQGSSRNLQQDMDDDIPF